MKSDMFDTEKFIREVKNRPALYDHSRSDYTSREGRTKLWTEVGAKMYKNWRQLPQQQKQTLVKELQTKWKSLRDQFRREIVMEMKIEKGERVGKVKKKYIFYDSLLFLKEFFDDVKKLDASNRGGNEEFVKCEIMSDNEQQSEDYEGSDVIQRPFVHELSSSVSVFEDPYRNGVDMDDDPMGNKNFLLSLLPIMNRMNYDQSLYVRFKVMELMQQLKTVDYQQGSL